ncbi:hypothetical protein K435DRAFT_859739 [Dendrothele bispora CBS 962.96]|uniref:Uncharacterized protein n=1 Tax=Dendrothele bispora (strain CBS 962.96) TaxID=1314807 RepID=A0A4S8LZV0_DENBC|nr:hypothetical protein K435DRAFT_859739 [Dendrothele bispora CBS 962.96]
MSPLTNGKVDKSSEMHFKVITGSQPAIYLTQAHLNLEGFMGNGFAAGGQRTTTVNVENFHGFPVPTRILGPELMDKFHEQSLRFWYKHHHRDYL